MLAANETVATYLEQKGVASIYRVHEPPDPKRVYDFENLAAAFGYSLGIGRCPSRASASSPIIAPRAQTFALHRPPRQAHARSRSRRQVAITPAMYQKLAAKIAGKPEERILSYLMLRSLKQARYSEVNDGHFALAATCYTHFTSPIRRFPDLLVHRILKGVLAESPEQHEGALAIAAGGHVQQNAESLWPAHTASQTRPRKTQQRLQSAKRAPSFLSPSPRTNSATRPRMPASPSAVPTPPNANWSSGRR